MSPPKRRLGGGGLDTLIPANAPAPAPAASSVLQARDAFVSPIEDVYPNRAQPRTMFDDEKLNELAASIREHGLLEPILVRRRAAGGYEIIAGERRWRASQRAGLHEVPVFVRELSPKQAFEAAIVENIQREDLNPLETARAFQRLVDEYGHTQESIAERVGKDRSSVANVMRLLKLPASVLARIESGALSEGHGRALLVAQDTRTIERLAAECAAKQWSVRETERRAREFAQKKTSAGAEKATPSANIRDLETKLARTFGVRAKVDDRGGKGSITLPYASLDELDRLLEQLMR